MKIIAYMALLAFLFTGCSVKSPDSVIIATNPWPGYAYLYLAEEQGFFKKHGIDVRIASFDSLADSQRAYIHDRVDGLASTIIESVQSHLLSNRPLNIILLADYSNGGDVIVAHQDIKRVEDLEGKTIGCEIGSLGIFMVQRALARHGMTLEDVFIRNVEQSDAEIAMLNREIDAYVTYPPVSIALLSSLPSHAVFTSAEIPFEIIHTVSVSQDVLTQDPLFKRKFTQAWKDALEYAKQNNDVAIELMTHKTGLHVSDFNETLLDIVVLDNQDQKLLQDKKTMIERANQVCSTLKYVDSFAGDCRGLADIVGTSEAVGY